MLRWIVATEKKILRWLGHVQQRPNAAERNTPIQLKTLLRNETWNETIKNKLGHGQWAKTLQLVCGGALQ